MAKVVGEKPEQVELLKPFIRKADCCHGNRSQSGGGGGDERADR